MPAFSAKDTDCTMLAPTGFGVVNASAAVDASRHWTNFGPEQELLVPSGLLNMKIADDPTIPTIDSLVVEGNESFVVESVVVELALQHASRGDLLISLISPSGTDSILSPSKRPENQQLGANETWNLMTVSTEPFQIIRIEPRPFVYAHKFAFALSSSAVGTNGPRGIGP